MIVVGGGLAGLSAAHTLLERGASVLLLDKCAFLGGNSTKATSGMNGAGTQAQRKLGIQVFYLLLIERMIPRLFIKTRQKVRELK